MKPPPGTRMHQDWIPSGENCFLTSGEFSQRSCQLCTKQCAKNDALLHIPLLLLHQWTRASVPEMNADNPRELLPEYIIQISCGFVHYKGTITSY